MAALWTWTAFLLLHSVAGSPIRFVDGGYEGVVVSIAEDVPRENCRVLLNNLEVSDGKGTPRKVNASK